MAASPIGIDRLRQSNIGRAVTGDDALRVLEVNDRLEAHRPIGRVLEPPIIGRFTLPFLETTFEVDRRTAALDDFAVSTSSCFQRHKTSLRVSPPFASMRKNNLSVVENPSLSA